MPDLNEGDNSTDLKEGSLVSPSDRCLSLCLDGVHGLGHTWARFLFFNMWNSLAIGWPWGLRASEKESVRCKGQAGLLTEIDITWSRKSLKLGGNVGTKQCCSPGSILALLLQARGLGYADWIQTRREPGHRVQEVATNPQNLQLRCLFPHNDWICLILHVVEAPNADESWKKPWIL